MTMLTDASNLFQLRADNVGVLTATRNNEMPVQILYALQSLRAAKVCRNMQVNVQPQLHRQLTVGCFRTTTHATPL